MISPEQAAATLKEFGLTLASEDDQIYKEPPQVQFMNRSGKSSKNTENSEEPVSQGNPNVDKSL